MSAHKSCNILLVEDSPGDAELMREAFEEHGERTSILWIEDGESALNYLFAGAKNGTDPLPDLILLDLNLPRKNGHEVLKTIKNDPVLKVIPVLVYSGSCAERDISAAYFNHANCYIAKPVNLEQFMHTARMIEKFWLNTARLSPSGMKFGYWS